jgi:diguanylate cyclase (GGDEF)-like protein
LVDQITHQALHDHLTGLANRLQFTDALAAAIAHAHRTGESVTVYYLDLDGFKPVNDQHGHVTGDRLLAAVGQRLSSCTRDSDIVARLGGDEFAVLTTGTPPGPVSHDTLYARLAAAFADPFPIDGLPIHLHVSIGHATYPDHASDADTLMRHADTAMFTHKRAHHNALASPSAGR